MTEFMDSTPSKPVYVLRTCAADMTSYNGFQWPESGKVSAPDWLPTAECGNGLHGFKWGEGNAELADWGQDAKWLVVRVIGQYIELGGKIKFKSGEVVFVGERDKATRLLAALADEHGIRCAIIGGTATAGDGGTATAGYGGTATAGYGGTATTGDYGTATAGYRGTATAGYRGTATAGYYGTATAGDDGTATAGDYGTATAGDGGSIQIQYYDAKRGRYRWKSAEVCEDGLKPGVKYRLNSLHAFEEVEPEPVSETKHKETKADDE